MTLYEYPFNERVRAYLRLEYLFDRLFFLVGCDDTRAHQIAVSTLFDILDALERTDVKGSILQDIERQRMGLTPLRGHPEVAQDALETMLGDMERVIGVLTSQGKTGQALRENEWLASLRGRLSVAGGSTQMDVPSFYAWQQKPIEARRVDLARWIDTLMGLCEGLALVLRLLRENGVKSQAVAEQGAYQQMLGGKTYQLLRIWVDPAQGVFPEISANKYMIWVRYATQDGELKPQSVARDVPFNMSLCTV
ncbi:MAG TPA: cell division protein ZapD [Bordetella sp.]